MTAQSVHGQDGMGDIGLPVSGRSPAGGHAVEVPIDTFLARPGEIDLVTLGPLTNVVLPVGEPPVFNVVIPTLLSPENPGTGILGAASESLSMWRSVEGFWEWYLFEGHPQAQGFDAAGRSELSPQAAEQLNWVHHRFWSEVVPRWDRVWNDAWAAERKQRRSPTPPPPDSTRNCGGRLGIAAWQPRTVQQRGPETAPDPAAQQPQPSQNLP